MMDVSPNTDCNHFIGLWYDYDNTEMITLERLKYNLKEKEDLYKAFCKNSVYSKIAESYKPRWTLDDYLNKRKHTNLARFDLCPDCGQKIDWKGMRNDA